jgi:hypothetical protein
VVEQGCIPQHTVNLRWKVYGTSTSVLTARLCLVQDLGMRETAHAHAQTAPHAPGAQTGAVGSERGECVAQGESYSSDEAIYIDGERNEQRGYLHAAPPPAAPPCCCQLCTLWYCTHTLPAITAPLQAGSYVVEVPLYR